LFNSFYKTKSSKLDPFLATYSAVLSANSIIIDLYIIYLYSNMKLLISPGGIMIPVALGLINRSVSNTIINKIYEKIFNLYKY